MHVPLKSPAALASLTRKQKTLETRLGDCRPLVERHLIPALLEFELSKIRQHILAFNELAPSRSGLEKAVSWLLECRTPIDRLEVEDLLKLHNLLVGGLPPPYRERPASPLTSAHEPVQPALISRALSRLMEWVRSPSFSQLHPVQQMTLSQIRLYEIYPFDRYSETAGSLFSYYFLVASNYLPPWYEIEELPQFYESLGQAFLFSTEPLVSLNAHACERAYDYIMKTGTV